MKEINGVKKRIRNKQVSKGTKIKIFMCKFLVVFLLFIILTFLVNKNPKLKNKIFQKIYSYNISFAKIKKIYNQKIGNVLPFQNLVGEKKVFNEKLTYKSMSKYNKGIKLSLEENYLIPALKGGIVIFSGTKNDMNTVIIQQPNGIDAVYSNLNSVNVKLYDYIEDNQIVGDAKDNILYLTFQKDGVEIDYKEAFK